MKAPAKEYPTLSILIVDWFGCLTGHSVRYSFKFCAYLLESIWSILILEHGLTFQSRVCFDSRFFFSRRLAFFFCLDSNFKISNRVCSHDICLVFFRSWTYILQISTHVFYCIRCILQVSTYVLRFQHVFTIGIILSATERHSNRYGWKFTGYLILICSFSSCQRFLKSIYFPHRAEWLLFSGHFTCSRARSIGL